METQADIRIIIFYNVNDKLNTRIWTRILEIDFWVWLDLELLSSPKKKTRRIFLIFFFISLLTDWCWLVMSCLVFWWWWFVIRYKNHIKKQWRAIYCSLNINTNTHTGGWFGFVGGYICTFSYLIKKMSTNNHHPCHVWGFSTITVTGRTSLAFTYLSTNRNSSSYPLLIVNDVVEVKNVFY